MKKMNLIFAGICAAIGALLIILAAGYRTAADYGTGVPGPGLWPIVISAVMLAMSALLVMKSVKMPAEKNTDVPMWNDGT